MKVGTMVKVGDVTDSSLVLARTTGSAMQYFCIVGRSLAEDAKVEGRIALQIAPSFWLRTDWACLLQPTLEAKIVGQSKQPGRRIEYWQVRNDQKAIFILAEIPATKFATQNGKAVSVNWDPVRGWMTDLSTQIQLGGRASVQAIGQFSLNLETATTPPPQYV